MERPYGREITACNRRALTPAHRAEPTFRRLPFCDGLEVLTCTDMETMFCPEYGQACSAEGECCDGFECHGEVDPICIDPSMCFPTDTECTSDEECCEGLVCTGIDVLKCTPAD